MTSRKELSENQMDMVITIEKLRIKPQNGHHRFDQGSERQKSMLTQKPISQNPRRVSHEEKEEKNKWLSSATLQKFHINN